MQNQSYYKIQLDEKDTFNQKYYDRLENTLIRSSLGSQALHLNSSEKRQLKITQTYTKLTGANQFAIYI